MGVLWQWLPLQFDPGSRSKLFEQALATALVETPDASLGTLLHQVRIEMTGRGEGVREVMETFLLFGDRQQS
jgi:hypothetical protein